MANVPLLRSPGFGAISRYEHTLGVCHLAQTAAKSLELSPRDSHHLMMAALYHDVATPPFAHAMEEVLAEASGPENPFDHERRTHEIMTDKAGVLKMHTQVFLGRRLTLPSLCEQAESRELGIDCLTIAEMIVGSEKHTLSALIHSKGMDLDNIDNVVRAATAMGLQPRIPDLGRRLARAFIQQGGRVSLSASERPAVLEWQRLRRELYTELYSSTEDFSLQTMVKHALVKLLQAGKLSVEDWSLTEEELVQTKLMAHPETRDICVRMRLGKTYACLSQVQLSGIDKADLPGLKSILLSTAKATYEDDRNQEWSSQRDGGDDSREQSSTEILLNSYVDRRERSPGLPFVELGSIVENRPQQIQPTFIVGLFTPGRPWSPEAEREYLRRISDELPGGIHISRFDPRSGAQSHVQARLV